MKKAYNSHWGTGRMRKEDEALWGLAGSHSPDIRYSMEEANDTREANAGRTRQIGRRDGQQIRPGLPLPRLTSLCTR